MKEKFILRLVVLISMFVVLLTSCEKDIELTLPEPEMKLVVEGWIEQDSVAVVAITRNSSYFDKVDSAVLANLFILDAKVFISDGVQTEQLQLDFSNAFQGIWPFVCYKGVNLKGVVGKTYTLTIYAEGDTIIGRTTIPEPATLDSLWWEPDNNRNPDNDTLGFIWAQYSDNPSVSEFYRIFTKRRGRDNTYIPVFGSVYSDEFFTGKTFSFYISRGIQTLTDIEAIQNDSELFYFKKGDTVDVKVTSIDRAHYDFWRTVEQELFTGGNPFVFPAVIRHNVENAVGVFGGYGATYYKLIIGN